MSEIKHLSLYHFNACPFCMITRQALSESNLNVEQRDILKDPQHRRDLIQGGGKRQVPCLRIDYQNGEVDWLYESADIIRYVNKLSLSVA